MTTRPQTQALLDRARTMQAENDTAQIAAREDVDDCLDLTILALNRERSYLQDTGNIADGEIQVPWNLLQEAIGRLRAAQAQGDNIQTTMEDLIADLADETL